MVTHVLVQNRGRLQRGKQGAEALLHCLPAAFPPGTGLAPAVQRRVKVDSDASARKLNARAARPSAAAFCGGLALEFAGDQGRLVRYESRPVAANSRISEYSASIRLSSTCPLRFRFGSHLEKESAGKSLELAAAVLGTNGRWEPIATCLVLGGDRYRRLPPLTANIGGWYCVDFASGTI